jgi:hypothetical protein
MTEAAAIVQRVWNYCNVLRDDGVSYGDYLEQLTYLLFLKMAEERAEIGRPNPPAGAGYPGGRDCGRAGSRPGPVSRDCRR